MPAAYPTDQATMAGMFFMRFTICGRDLVSTKVGGWALRRETLRCSLMFFAIPFDEPILDEVPRHHRDPWLVDVVGQTPTARS